MAIACGVVPSAVCMERLLKFLNLDELPVRSLSIHFAAESVAIVEVGLLMTDAQVDDVVEVLKSYSLVEVDACSSPSSSEDS